MTDEGSWAQSKSDKQHQYYGSHRDFYSGVTPGSTTVFAWLGFSGTNTGFGAANNVLCQRFEIVASGGNARAVDWAWVSGTSPTLAGQLFPGEFFAKDGVNRSGVWVRTSEAAAELRVWAW